MVSVTATLALFFTIPFTIIALCSLKEYLKDREDSRKKHAFYAFSCVSIGFVLNFTGALMVSPDMSPGELMAANILSKLFDVFNIIGVFWIFVFLTDFVEKMKKYIPLAFIHMTITVIIIFLTKAGVTILVGSEYVIERSNIRSLAILFFWFLYWSITAHQFWKCSKSITTNVAMLRCRMMSVGAVFAVFAYVGVMLAKVYHSMILEFTGEIFAIASGIVFYIGFVTPKRFRRRWEKPRRIKF